MAGTTGAGRQSISQARDRAYRFQRHCRDGGRCSRPLYNLQHNALPTDTYQSLKFLDQWWSPTGRADTQRHWSPEMSRRPPMSIGRSRPGALGQKS